MGYSLSMISWVILSNYHRVFELKEDDSTPPLFLRGLPRSVIYWQAPKENSQLDTSPNECIDGMPAHFACSHHTYHQYVSRVEPTSFIMKQTPVIFLFKIPSLDSEVLNQHHSVFNTAHVPRDKMKEF